MSSTDSKGQAAERRPKPDAKWETEVVVQRPSFVGKINALKEQHSDVYKEFERRLKVGWDIAQLSSWVRACSSITLTEFEITMYDTARLRGRSHLKKVMAGEKRQEMPEVQGDSQGAHGSLRANAISELRNCAARMLAEARRNPKSDASKIIEILLIDQMANEDVRVADAKQLLQEQSRRNQLEKENEFQKEKLEYQAKGLKLRKKQIEAARQTVKAAQQALKEGRPFDQSEVIEKLSAAIGMSGPPERRVEP